MFVCVVLLCVHFRVQFILVLGGEQKKTKKKTCKVWHFCRFFLAIDKQRQYVNKICALDAAGKIEKKKGREEKAGRDCVRALKDKAVH